MTGTMLRPGVELSDDRRFTGRIRRLVAISAVALGVIALLAAVTTESPTWVIGLLGLGWITMPTVLALSVRRPRLRYALAVPAGLVSIGLVSLCLGWLPAESAGALGWLLVSAGVLAGGILGSWFWYRLGPVPSALAAPFAAPRLGLIALHAGLITLGVALIIAAAL